VSSKSPQSQFSAKKKTVTKISIFCCVSTSSSAPFSPFDLRQEIHFFRVFQRKEAAMHVFKLLSFSSCCRFKARQLLQPPQLLLPEKETGKRIHYHKHFSEKQWQ
jgi:hypothetical protein